MTADISPVVKAVEQAEMDHDPSALDALSSIYLCPMPCHDRPGSDSAILDGCVCPVMDNGHGHASRLVVVVGCPVHDSFLKESS